MNAEEGRAPPPGGDLQQGTTREKMSGHGQIRGRSSSFGAPPGNHRERTIMISAQEPLRERSIPVIEAVRQGNSITFPCEYCRATHWHGAHGSCDGCGCHLHEDILGWPCTCPIGAGNGHRVAHCWNPKSPYKVTGYVLVEVAAAPKKRTATVMLTGWCRAGTPPRRTGCTPREVRKPARPGGALEIIHHADCTWMRAQLAGRPEIRRAIEQAKDFVVVDGIRADGCR